MPEAAPEVGPQHPPPEIAPEPTGRGLPLGKCEAYNHVYDQSCGSS